MRKELPASIVLTSPPSRKLELLQRCWSQQFLGVHPSHLRYACFRAHRTNGRAIGQHLKGLTSGADATTVPRNKLAEKPFERPWTSASVPGRMYICEFPKRARKVPSSWFPSDRRHKSSRRQT